MRYLSWLPVLGLAATLACEPRAPSDDKDDADTDTDVDSDTDVDTDTDTDTDVGFTCADGPTALGPWDDGGITHPIAAAGGSTTPDAYTNDAGLGGIISAVTGEFNEIPLNVPVNGAIVTAVGYVPAVPTDNTVTMWLEDASGPLVAFRVDVGTDPNTIDPGDEVQFMAVAGQEYFGTPQITQAANFTVVSKDNPIHVVDGNAVAPITFADHHLYVVEVFGELTAGPEDCGSNCYDLTYAGQTSTFRTGSDFPVIGDCIHWIGPVGSFSEEVQLDADDFDWYRFF